MLNAERLDELNQVSDQFLQDALTREFQKKFCSFVQTGINKKRYKGHEIVLSALVWECISRDQAIEQVSQTQGVSTSMLKDACVTARAIHDAWSNERKRRETPLKAKYSRNIDPSILTPEVVLELFNDWINISPGSISLRLQRN